MPGSGYDPSGSRGSAVSSAGGFVMFSYKDVLQPCKMRRRPAGAFSRVNKPLLHLAVMALKKLHTLQYLYIEQFS